MGQRLNTDSEAHILYTALLKEEAEFCFQNGKKYKHNHMTSRHKEWAHSLCNNNALCT